MNFDKICNDIRGFRIQGEENIAKAGVKALKLRHDKKSIEKLLHLRQDEPCLTNAIKFAKQDTNILADLAIMYFEEADKKIAQYGIQKIRKNAKVFTHGYSPCVISILNEAKKEKRKFDVFFTKRLGYKDTTAEILSKLKIKAVMLDDDAVYTTIKESDLIILGAHAILLEKNRISAVLSTIGAGMFAEIAYDHKIPLYIATNSWKVTDKKLRIEHRIPKSIKLPKGICIIEPSFGIIDPKFIRSFISEVGVIKTRNYVKRVKQEYPWILK